MNRELFRSIEKIEAKVLQLEEVFHGLSSYIEEMDTNSKEANTELSRQVNVALKEIDNRFKELEKDEVRDKKGS